MYKGLFLDRDGILNYSQKKGGRPYAPRRLEDFILYEELASILSELSGQQVKIIVVTNQPDLATGLQTKELVEEMHAYLRSKFTVDDIVLCSHVDEDKCNCRKPLPGMILSSASHWDLDLKQSIMIGDRWRDVEAGIAAGCYTIFVDHGYEEKYPNGMDAVVKSPLEALKLAQIKFMAK